MLGAWLVLAAFWAGRPEYFCSRLLFFNTIIVLTPAMGSNIETWDFQRKSSLICHMLLFAVYICFFFPSKKSISKDTSSFSLQIRHNIYF